MARILFLVTVVFLALLPQQQAAYARIAPKAFISNSAARPKAEQPTSWSIGDILVASHNAVGFPRVDVLDPSDLTVKDSVDLVPACGGQSKTRGISFSPRFSSMKLQLAVSCAPDSEQSQSQDGKVVFTAAKAAQHPVVKTLQIQSPGASVYDRVGAFYVFGKQQPAAAAAVVAAASTAVSSVATGAAAPVSRQLLDAVDNTAASLAESLAKGNAGTLHASASQRQQPAATVNSATAAAAAPQPLEQAPPATAKPKVRSKTPTVLFKLEATPSAAALAAADKQQDGSSPAAAAVPQVAAVMPSWIASSEDLSLDLGPRGSELYYTLGKNMLRTFDTESGQHLPDQQLPAGNCLGVLAQFDGTLLVACGKCLYHLPASDTEPPLRHACLDLSAPFGRYMAMDATGSHLLISTLDGGLHSVQVSDFKPVKHTALPGRMIGGVAFLGTVPANQQDCIPGTGCCPYGRILASGSPCRKAETECAEEAQCDGVSPMCPESPVKTMGTICRQARKPCEQHATCDGLSNKCPPNSFKTNGTRCANGRVDNMCAPVGECDGVTGECQGADRTQGETCEWSPDDEFNIFKKAYTHPAIFGARDVDVNVDETVRADSEVGTAALPASLSPALQQLRPALQQLSPHLKQAAVGIFRSWARRGRNVLGAQSPMSGAKPLAVCDGQCMDSKCVMTVTSKGCCVLPGSRLDGDDEVGTDGDEETWSLKGQKHQRGTEEDLYCWD